MGAKISFANAKKLGIKAPKQVKKRIPVPPLGLPTKQIVVELPFPPTVNTYYRIFRNRMLISRDGRRYRNKVAAVCKKNVNAHTVGRLFVYVWVVPCDNRERDIDNLGKALLDSLQKAGVIINDAHIDLLTFKRQPKEDRARVIVRITGEEPTDLFRNEETHDPIRNP